MNAGASIHPIPLKKRSQAARLGGRGEELLQRCRTMALERLGEALKSMLDRADDALFDLADKSVNTTEQTQYFDAMREVRLKRETISEDYRTEFGKGFDGKCRARRNARLDFRSLDADSMEFELVADDDMEESIAVSNMQGKTASNCHQELFALDKRVAVLLGESTLDADDNPLGPKTICVAFQEACHCIESDVKIRLILLKLFDKCVLSQVPSLYRDLNRLLADNDILPQIRTTVAGNTSHRPAGSAQAAPAETIEEAEQDMLTTLQRLVELRSGQGPASGAAGYSAPGAPIAGGSGTVAGGTAQPGWLMPGGAALPASGLVQGGAAAGGGGAGGSSGGAGGGVGGGAAGGGGGGPGGTGTGAGPGGGVPGGAPAVGTVIMGLTTLQQGDFGAVADGGEHLDEQAFSSGRVNILRDLKSAKVVGGLGHDEEVIIDIVAMLFDYILDDDSIPDSMKALIGRLQIPVLKVAILDRAFFSRKNHPARRLLDMLADAAIGWNEDSDAGDTLFRQVESIVHRVLDDFEDDIGLFATLVEELEAYLDNERRQAQQRAERSAEVLKRKERLEEAKGVARQEIAARLAAVDEAFMVLFLEEHWQNLLVMLHLKHGPDSKSWRSGLQTMDDLIWSVAPKESVEDRQQLVQLLPQLVRRLRNGMKLVALSPASAQTFLGELARRHAAAVRISPTTLDQPLQTPDPLPPQADRGAEPGPETAELPPDDAAPTAEDCLPANAEPPPVTVLETAPEDAAAEAPLQPSPEAREEAAPQQPAAMDLAQDPFGETLARSHITYYEQPVLAPERPDDNGATALHAQGSDPARTASDDSQDDGASGQDDGDAAPGDSDAPAIGFDAEARAAIDDDITLEDITYPAPSHEGSGNGVSGEGMSAAATAVDEDITLEDIRQPDPEASAAEPENLDATIPEPGAAAFIKAGWLQFSADSADMEIEEITLGEASAEETDVQDVPDDEHFQQARNLATGTWVEFSDGSGGAVRARLSWVSSATGVYLFTDRKGLKVAERTLFGLAAEFRRGSARLIESVPLIDRAVSNLLNGFNKAATAQNTP